MTADGPGTDRATGTLYVVSTPIGNLGDVTLRAIEVLRDVPLIAAEDTRLTHRLLDRHGIGGRMTSFHAHSTPGRLNALLDHLRGGADLALVTDAGTPAVSDPGADLVAAWAAEGMRLPAPEKAAAQSADCCMKLRREILLRFAMSHSLWCWLWVFPLEVPQEIVARKFLPSKEQSPN